MQDVVEPPRVDRFHDGGKDELAVDAVQAPEQQRNVQSKWEAEGRKDVITDFADHRRVFNLSFIRADEIIDEGDRVITSVNNRVDEC